MFGPANAGGPAQANTNPGASPQQPAQLPPPPDPQAMEARNQAPEPQGVKVLPQGTAIQPNTGVLNKPTQPKVEQPGSPQQGPIELLPGDPDPNLLPPEIRDSWMFRYQQAQRAAAYKAAEEQARWGNIVGGVGNIAQIISGGRPTNQTGLRAEEPKATDVGTLYGWKKDYDSAQQAAAAKAKYEGLITQLKRDNPGATPSDIDAMAMDPAKVASYGYNRTDAKAIADAAAAQIGVVKATQGLAGKGIDDPEVIKETAKALGKSEAYVRAMPVDARIDAVKSLEVSQAQGQGAPGKGFTEALVKETVTAAETAVTERKQMTGTQRALDIIRDKDNKLWVGGLYGQPAVQQAAQFLGGVFGDQQLSGITDAQKLQGYLSDVLVARASTFGKAPSDAEGKAIKEMIGKDGTINRDALEVIVQANLRRQVEAQIHAVKRLDESGKVFADDPRSQAYLAAKRQELSNIPDVTNQLFEAPVMAALVANQNDPAVIADFDRKYGDGMAAYVISKRGAPPNAGT
jgi:hypothetical protein